MPSTIRLPQTSTRRGNDGAIKTWMKVLSSVDENATNGFGFDGTFCDRGALINSTAIAADAVLLEAAGNDGSAKNTCPTFVLWQRQGDEFVQLARAEGKEWAFALRDIAIKALTPTVAESKSASPALLKAFADFKTALEAERALWIDNAGSREAIDDALWHLVNVQDCIDDINDKPDETDLEFAQREGFPVVE